MHSVYTIEADWTALSGHSHSIEIDRIRLLHRMQITSVSGCFQHDNWSRTLGTSHTKSVRCLQEKHESRTLV